MPISHRQFTCARCRLLVRICSDCDRGHRYCHPDCSASNRREQTRAAGRRHRQREAGREGAARRQRSYRKRCKERQSAATEQNAPVTHQGSSFEGAAVEVGLSVRRRRTSTKERPDEKKTSISPMQHLRPRPRPTPRSSAQEPSTGTESAHPVAIDPDSQVQCDFCGRPCGNYARSGFKPPPIRQRRWT